MVKRIPRNKKEAREMAKRRQENIDLPPEDHLQASIITSWYDKYPENINDLIGYDANGTDGRDGARKQAMGTRPKVSDLMWFKDHVCHGLEVKLTYKPHDAEHVLGQCKFILEKCGRGAFITSLEMFWDYVEGRGVGIPAQFVKDYILHTGVKTVLFSNVLKLWENERQ
jgi:hypothetical protein